MPIGSSEVARLKKYEALAVRRAASLHRMAEAGRHYLDEIRAFAGWELDYETELDWLARYDALKEPT